MRIGVARIWQETNTFSPKKTTLEDFHVNGLHLGAELLEHLAGLPELAGARAAAEACREPVELVPILAAMAWPAGRLTEQTFTHLRDGFGERLDACGHLDGLFVSLHGALSAETCDDVEGSLLVEVRRRRGPALPIVVSLDMHANITRAMMQAVDAAVGYHTCPHLDMEQTGRRAMEILIDTISGKIEPAMTWRKVPMIVPADRHNHVAGPLHELLDRLARVEATQGVLSCSLFPVQPWLDVESLGWSTLVVTDGRGQLAQELADDLARECWRRRHEFFVEKVSPTEAVGQALATDGGPVVISDSADATNSGAPGNSTCLLKAMLDIGLTESALLTMVAPNAVDQAYAAGIGATIEVEFGTVPVNPFSRPLTVIVRVVSFHDGTIRLQGHLGNLVVNMGRTAVLAAGEVKIVASEVPGPGHVPPEFFARLDLDVKDAKIIVAKSPVGFRAGYEPIAAGIILCQSPGPACSDLTSLTWERRPAALFPFDSALQWSPAVAEQTR